MWSFLFVPLLLSAQSGRAVVLDRNQLASWIPNYLTDYQFYLIYLQIESISAGTFTGLSQLKQLSLQSNQLNSIEASILNGLSQLQYLELSYNNLISLDRNIFVGLLNLEEVYLGSNPISQLQPSYVKQLCSTNPWCTIYIYSI
jgi:Leucine-rich repeat (LRR) protein